jgi:pyruvate/2-oxoglutarate dehydrogenase complex dihydrolipoamide acyltransferase (E2) component
MLELRLDPATWGALEDDVEALLAEWSVSPGDAVTAGQEIGVVEVVKASVAIVAPVAGHIGALCVPVGTTFGRDAVLALVRTD